MVKEQERIISETEDEWASTPATPGADINTKAYEMSRLPRSGGNFGIGNGSYFLEWSGSMKNLLSV
ncbi:hypothetical protein ACJ72_01359 [Emergomyces africanus]|uniref:Uncharacterized protein n=1 Tax=Emergomyces africanus TaxID=1955775 RepID=A0A1B7P5H5_9EURO|nr:hypothetical protein ACJ72_01359 [Emergomyces africanus]